MIIGHDLMVQLGLKAEFGHKILEWDDTVVPMNDPVNLLGQTDLTKRNMGEVVIHTKESASDI